MKQGNPPKGRNGGKNEQRANSALSGIREHLKNRSGFLGASLGGPSGNRHIVVQFMGQQEMADAKLDPRYRGVEVRAEIPKRLARRLAA